MFSPQERETETETERQTDRDRQTDRQKQRMTVRERERENSFYMTLKEADSEYCYSGFALIRIQVKFPGD